MALAAVDFVTGAWVYPSEQARADVTSLYDLRGPYFGALDLLEGADPYRGGGAPRPSDRLASRLGIDRMATLYSPPVLTLMTPLARMRFSRARVVALGVGFACALLCIPALLWAAGEARSLEAWAAMGFLVASFSELQRGLALGQLHAPLLLLLALGTGALRRGRDGPGGALLGLAALIKPVPAVLVGGLLLARRWRAAAFAVGAVAAALALSAALWGVAPLLGFADAVGDAARDVNVSRDNQSLQAAVARLALAEPRNVDWTEVPAGARALWLGLVAAVGALAAWLATRQAAPLALRLGLVLTAGVLISPRVWHHYVTWLLLPYAVALWRLAETGRWRLAGLLAVSYAVVSHPARAAKLAAWLLPLPASLVQSAQCWGILLLFAVLAVAVRREPPPPAAAPAS